MAPKWPPTKRDDQLVSIRHLFTPQYIQGEVKIEQDFSTGANLLEVTTVGTKEDLLEVLQRLQSDVELLVSNVRREIEGLPPTRRA